MHHARDNHVDDDTNSGPRKGFRFDLYDELPDVDDDDIPFDPFTPAWEVGR